MQVIYLHIPKTAGTSIRRYLGDQFRRDQTCPYDGWQEWQQNDRTTTANLIAGHFDVRLLRLLPLAPRKVITFLRDPVARTVSALQHAMHDPAFRHRELDLGGRKLNDLLLDPDVMRFFANTQTCFLSSVDLDCADPVTIDVATALSFDTLIPDLGCAIRNLEKLDFCGLTEHLSSDLLALSDLLGTYPPEIAPMLNTSGRAIPHQLTREQLNSVVGHNACDLELYENARKINAQYKRRERAYILADFLSRPSPEPAVHFVSRRPFWGCGFHEEEHDDHARPFRWSGSGSETCLTFRIKPSHAQIVMLELWLPGHPFCSAVDLSSDSPIKTVWMHKQGRWCTYLIHVAEHEQTWIDLAVRADQVSNAEHDLRAVGFVLMDAEIYPGFRGYLRKMRFLVRRSRAWLKTLCRQRHVVVDSAFGLRAQFSKMPAGETPALRRRSVERTT